MQNALFCNRTKVWFGAPTATATARALQQFQFQCTCNGFGPSLHFQFGKDILVVPLHGAQRQEQAFADLLIGMPFLDQAQNFQFPLAEGFERQMGRCGSRCHGSPVFASRLRAKREQQF